MTGIGLLGFHAVKSYEHIKSNYPPFVLYTILLSLIAFPILFIILVTKGESKKKKHMTAADTAATAKKFGSSATNKKKD